MARQRPELAELHLRLRATPKGHVRSVTAVGEILFLRGRAGGKQPISSSVGLGASLEASRQQDELEGS